jgi:hypothetical protein
MNTKAHIDANASSADLGTKVNRLTRPEADIDPPGLIISFGLLSIRGNP